MNEGGMLAFAAAHPDDVAFVTRNNEELLSEGYQGLGKYPRYNENLGYASATTPWYASDQEGMSGEAPATGGQGSPGGR